MNSNRFFLYDEAAESLLRPADSRVDKTSRVARVVGYWRIGRGGAKPLVWFRARGPRKPENKNKFRPFIRQLIWQAERAFSRLVTSSRAAMVNKLHAMAAAPTIDKVGLIGDCQAKAVQKAQK
jgi:hypothetical protein